MHDFSVPVYVHFCDKSIGTLYEDCLGNVVVFHKKNRHKKTFSANHWRNYTTVLLFLASVLIILFALFLRQFKEFFVVHLLIGDVFSVEK